MRPGLLIPALLGASLLSGASRDPWVRVRSPHFELFTTGGQESGTELAGYFEQVRTFFQQALGLEGAATPVRIVTFRTDQEYQPYRASAVADAYFQPGLSHDYIVMKSASGDVYTMAVHEYTHLLLRQTHLEVPQWLNEGLADLYSSLEVSNAQVVVGKVIPGRAQALADEPWIDLRALVSAGPASALYNQHGKAEMFYAESWALVHMLTLDERYSPRLPVLMETLRDGDSVAAIQRAYGKPIGKVQDDLKSYFAGDHLNAAVFDVPLPTGAQAMQVETDAGLYARLALAELLSNDRTRLDRARSAYESLSREYENQWQVEEGWGEFLARERQISAAIPHFERAAGLGSDDPRMYLEYGRLLNDANRSEDAARVFRTAVKLAPAGDEAHFELAVTLVRMGSYGEAVTEFHAIRHLGPEHAFRYFYSLAEAHYRLGDTRQAGLLLEKARAQARNREETLSVERLTQALDRPAR